jgi:phosphoglucomutase/phosphomannomutase
MVNPDFVSDPTAVAVLLRNAEEHLSPEASRNLRLWLTDETYAEYRAEILETAQRGAWTELEDAFYTVIPFGTGGRRGPRGAGPNRINRRTIAESARGLADWVAAGGDEAKRRGIVIAYDTRHGSPEFSQVCAQVIAKADVAVYLFDGFRSTPELSLAVRHLGAKAGIVVSASHNPPGDNGFKAYGEDGGQLVPPDDAAVMDYVREASDGAIPLMDFEEAKESGRVRIIGADVDRAYQMALATVPLTNSRNVRIVYTPLHGVGATAVLPAFAAAGFRDVHVVESQSVPDGDFPAVADNIPNPEVPAALAQARELAERIDADLALATDPDADRLGCMAKRSGNGTAEWAPLTGNQIGAILCSFVADELTKQGRMPPDPLVIRTTVTTHLIDRIAEHYGIGLFSDLLVGFKYVACVLKHLDDEKRFIFGTEESHGYLSTPHVHDKDGANAALLLAEAAARVKEEGRDLWAYLDEIYQRFGYHSERLENYVRPGRAGQEEVATMLDRLRERPPRSVAGMEVLRLVDRLTDRVRDMRSGQVSARAPTVDPKTGSVIEQLRLATDNLIILELGPNQVAEGGMVAIRPSGTEPKCKFYVAAHSPAGGAAGHSDLAAMKAEIDALTDAARTDIVRYALSLA